MENLTRKEREKLFRKQEIINAAIQLFAEKGYEYTTLDEIAELAEFGKGTLYNYFQNKEEIFLAILEDVFTDYTEVLEETYNQTTTFREFLTKLTNLIFSYCLANKASFLLLMRHEIPFANEYPLAKMDIVRKNREKSLDVFSKRIASAVLAGEVREVEPQSFVILYNSLIFSFVHHLLECKTCGWVENIDQTKESEFLLNILFDGISKK